MDPIPINKEKDKFFIAVAQKGYHSYFFAGVQQLSEGKPIEGAPIKLLTAIGKVNTEAKGRWAQLWLDITNFLKLFICCMFQSAMLQAEEFVESKGSSANLIRYKAFHITFDEYLKLLFLLVSINNQGGDTYEELKFYIPNQSGFEFTYETYQGEEKEKKTYSSRLKKIISSNNQPIVLNETLEHINNNCKKLTLTNSCRNTAIDFLKYTLEGRDVGTGVSKNPLSKLPFETFICGGQLDPESFYILPFSPKFYTDIPDAHKGLLIFYINV